MDSSTPEIPQLLLEQSDAKTKYIKVFSFDKDTMKAYEVDTGSEPIWEGSQGDIHRFLDTSKDMSGLLLGESGPNGTSRHYKISFIDRHLAINLESEGNADNSPNNNSRSSRIFWISAKEKPTLDTFLEFEWPAGDGDTVLHGRLERLTYQEVLDLQGINDPNPGYDHSKEIFYIFVLDKPQSVAGFNVDGVMKRIVSIQFIKIVDQEGLDQYLDRDINMTISPYDVDFPSDTSIPLGKPYTTNVTFSE